ncbi:hypothetical protein AOLI_G00123920 [Acnodon oligacanthus]
MLSKFPSTPLRRAVLEEGARKEEERLSGEVNGAQVACSSQTLSAGDREERLMEMLPGDLWLAPVCEGDHSAALTPSGQCHAVLLGQKIEDSGVVLIALTEEVDIQKADLKMEPVAQLVNKHF